MPFHTTTRRALGLGLAIALAACGNAEQVPVPGPGPGQPAPSPAPPPPPPADELAISISPQSGPHGTPVTVQASGFDANARVGIGVGPPQSEYEIIAHAHADANGTVTTTVNVPDWTEPGRDYLFVARAPTGEDVISSRFRVTAADGEPDQPNRARVSGVLTGEGVECPVLRSDSGELYTLAGDLGEFGEGDRVEVEGTIAEMSFCQQGTTIEVERIRAG